jgi:hypothetical protein
MVRKCVASLSLILFIIFVPLGSVGAVTKNSKVKEGATCAIFGKVSKKLHCATVNGKNIWQSITLSDGSKIIPNEGSECFFFKNILVLGKATSGERIQLECVWDNGIIGSKAHWISNQWTYKKSLSDSSRSIIANAWKSILSLPRSNNQFKVIYHVENGVNQEVVSIYKEKQNLFLQYFGDYFDPKLPFHTVISNSWEYLLSENLKIDAEIPGYSKWFSESHNKKYWERAKSLKAPGYPYASKKDVCSYTIDSNFNLPCPKLEGYVTGILLYPGYKTLGDEIAMPAHEAFELVQESIAQNHFAWPAWLRSGGPAFIGSVIATDTEVLSVKGGVLNPIPNIPKGRVTYDLTKAEDQFNQEKYSHGRYANALLIGNNGITAYLKFLKDASNGTNWEMAMKDNFGFDKKTFYKNFENFLYQYSAAN